MSRATLLILFVLSVNACYYDSGEFLFPDIDNSCDTSSVTFSGTIQPLLGQYCYRCHSNANASMLGGSIRLEDHADVAGRANDGSLYGAVTHAPGYSPMPQDGGKLDDCNIAILKAWIDAGSTDN